MSGTVTVTTTSDWLTPFEVEIHADEGEAHTARFTSAARAQTYAVANADDLDFTLVYRDLRPVESDQPRRISLEEFQARIPRICGKCRQSKPLNQYRGLTHRNQHTARGTAVMHGYAERCLDCEEAHGA